jgi:sulfoxide reductase heme-binding subunit YedZ
LDLTLRIALWLGAAAPGAWLLAGHFRGWLGVNPIEKLTHVTGMAALVLLLVTLAVTPVRRLTGWNPLIRIRRPLGLFAFFYACLHVAIWMVLDLGLRFEWVWEDVRERPYITVGLAAFVLLVPLAVTSTRGWIQRLGRTWGRLHRLVYASAALGIVHFYWLVKSDVRLPLLLAGVFALLMAARVPAVYHASRRRASRRCA